MFSVVGLVIVLIVRAKSYAEVDLNNYEGWRPLTSEQVLNLHRKVIKAPDVIYSTVLQWEPIVTTEENIGHAELNANIEPQDINRQLIGNIDFIGVVEKQNHESVADKDQYYNSNYLSTDENKTTYIPRAEHRRQAKNINDNIQMYDDNNDRNNHQIEIDTLDKEKNKKPHHQIEIDTLEKENHKETNIINDESITYEVTEVSEASEIGDLLDIDQTPKVYKKSNFEPTLTTPEKNLSNILFNILGNYKIRLNDNLTNYALSRNKQNFNTHKPSYGYWSHPTNRIQPVRNSENYLPLDPLLAVFLSNYGFYLPGYYGFPGNYNNIYGYLASNNIHNNKPFGAYKVYSDTDPFH